MTKKEFIEKWTHEDFELYSTILDDLESISDLPEQNNFELQPCDKCFQLTNHLNGVCQKCKPITDEQFEKELQKRLYRMRMKSDEIGLTQQNYDWIKDQLLKGGKG